MKIFLLTILLTLVSGCVPYFYSSESYILESPDIQEIGFMEMRDCLKSKSIVQGYLIDKPRYVIDFEIQGLTVWIKVSSKSGADISVRSEYLEINKYPLRKGDGYLFLLESLATKIVNLEVIENESVIATEIFRLKRISCSAMMYDSI